jgi:hypothetical protein
VEDGIFELFSVDIVLPVQRGARFPGFSFQLVDDAIQAHDLSSQWFLLTTSFATGVDNLPGKLKKIEQVSGSGFKRHGESVENAGSQCKNHSLEVFYGHAA